MHPPDRHGRRARTSSRLEADQRKLYDLIWKRTHRQPDGGRAAGADHGRCGQPRRAGRPCAPPGRSCCSTASSRSTRKAATTRTTTKAACRRSCRASAAEKRAVTPDQHFTQPPPRYTEATLVKRMEELGIGRPSTYACDPDHDRQDREYVRKDKNRLIPEDKGRLVTAFLTNFFRSYVEYDFTADLEDRTRRRLGRRARLQGCAGPLLARFLRRGCRNRRSADRRGAGRRSTISLPRTFTRRAPTASDPRICQVCGTGRLHLKTARSGGAFIGCGNYPECRYTRPISAGERRRRPRRWPGPGQDENGVPISLRAGPLRALCPARRGDGGEAQADRAPACPRAGRRTA